MDIIVRGTTRLPNVYLHRDQRKEHENINYSVIFYSVSQSPKMQVTNHISGCFIPNHDKTPMTFSMPCSALIAIFSSPNFSLPFSITFHPFSCLFFRRNLFFHPFSSFGKVVIKNSGKGQVGKVKRMPHSLL